MWVDAGDDFTSEFTKLASYNDELVYKATAATDLLVVGKTYRFISRAMNDVGYSEYSIYSYIAFGNVPDAPGVPQRVFSTENSVYV